MAKILNPKGRRRKQNEKNQQKGEEQIMKETVGNHFVNGKKVFENKKDNRGFIFNMSR